MDSTESAALAELFALHNRALRFFLLTKTGNEQEAQEVAQEAYARLLQLNQPRGIGCLRAYLFKTALHIAVDRARQQRIRERICGVLAPGEIESPGPERELLAHEELGIVAQALTELPANYRRAFLRRRYDGWTPEQIARELGIQLRMVRNYISRSTQYCRLRAEGVAPLRARQLAHVRRGAQ